MCVLSCVGFCLSVGWWTVIDLVTDPLVHSRCCTGLVSADSAMPLSPFHERTHVCVCVCVWLLLLVLVLLPTASSDSWPPPPATATGATDGGGGRGATGQSAI